MAKDFDGNFTQQEPLRAEAVSPAIEVMNSEAPVPGAIAGAVGLPILVETTRDLVIDGDDLAEKISFSGAKILMLSHMRGHIAGTDALGRLCIPRGVIIIEDCAHTMGTAWGQVKSGRHGRVAGFSTQIYKHMNSGEGGLITSDDPELMARATVLSGYYMLYGRHLAGRPERVRLQTPNCSGRIDNLRAAVLRPQLARLDENCARWNERYHAVSHELANVPDVRLPERPGKERFVASSIKFNQATIRFLPATRLAASKSSGSAHRSRSPLRRAMKAGAIWTRKACRTPIKFRPCFTTCDCR